MVNASEAAPVTVEPLTEERFEDLAALFMEGGDPKWCWCMYFRTPGLSWSNSTAKGNREGLRVLAAKRPAPGLVAYRDGSVVGWVGLGPRDTYDRLASSKLLAPVDDKPVWSIVCFVVSARRRKQGIARMLLDGAVEYARAHGATILESYPLSTGRGRVAPSSAYHGSQSMFEKAGFSVVEVRQWNKTSPQRPIMRLELS
jgi:ribosomal protein S18 acetylase RimI-like enzyme